MNELANKLKAFLAERKGYFVDVQYGSGGCDTYGFGADELDVVDMDALNKQIDEFCESFKKAEL